MYYRNKTIRVFFITLIGVMVLAGGSYGQSSAAQGEPKPFVIPGLVTVELESDVNVHGMEKGFGRVAFGVATLDRLLNEFGVSEARKLFPWHTGKETVEPGRRDPSRYFELSFPDTVDVYEVIRALEQNPHIRLAEPVWAIPLEATPNDPQWSNQWAMSPPEPDPYFYDAWDIETGSDSIKFACIDSGVNYRHEDLKGNIWVNPGEDLDGDGVVFDVDDLNGIDDDGNGITDDLIGYDFFTGGFPVWTGEDADTPDPNPSDFDGHGTHVAGIAAAMNNNGVGVTGAAGGWYGGNRAFRGVRIMCIRVGAMGSDGYGYVNSNNCGTAISYAANNGAHVINCSWGSQQTSTMIVGMQDAAAHGVTVVHAAGNDGADNPDYLDDDPYTEVLSVAALGPNSDVKWNLSNYGNWIDVSAPGANILSTSSEFGAPGYLSYYGTSMAAPMVSGLALLIRSAMPSLTKEQVDSIIINTADSIDYLQDPLYQGKLGSGRINAYRALVDLPSAKFTADVTEGNVPLLVHFTDLSPNSPTSWHWYFGTGDDSTVQNPTYEYTSPGVYSVSLYIDDGNPLGLGEEHLKNYIWARADTCVMDSFEVEVGSKVVMPVYLANTAQVTSIQFAFSFTNSNGITLDSFSTAGLRTESFYSASYTAFDPNNQRYVILLQPSHPDSSHYMLPDTGAILNLYFDVDEFATAGEVVIDTATVNGKAPVISTIWGDYWPVFTPGKIVIPLCDHGDADCSGDINVADLTALVNYLFKLGPPVDQNGGDVDGDGNINVSDVTYLVNYLFKGGPPPPA